MIQYKKVARLGNCIAGVALILNVLLFKMAFTDNADMYWLLVASIPLLSIGIYIAWLANRLQRKYYINNQEPDAVKPDFNWVPQFGYSNHAEEIDLNISIGNNQCRLPYKASILNIEPKRNIQNGESIYHLTEKKNSNPENPKQHVPYTYYFGEGLVWQITPDYLGCSGKNGHFSSEAFKKIAGLHEIKMIELLLLSSSKKSKQHSDPVFDFDEPLVKKRNNNVFQEAGYSTFNEAEGMIHFMDSLRALSGGKPIGIRLCINDKKEFYQICYAIRKTQFVPDFITVEGSCTKQTCAELKQTASAPIPLYEALQFVSATLKMYSLENQIKLIAVTEIVSDFDILKLLALGADSVFCEIDNYNTINNSSKEHRFQKRQTITDIQNKHIPGIIKLMQTVGFRKISDITLPDLFRSMESSQPLNEPVRYQGSVRKIHTSKPNNPAIKMKENRSRSHNSIHRVTQLF